LINFLINFGNQLVKIDPIRPIYLRCMGNAYEKLVGLIESLRRIIHQK
jgi:hypothetical protein